MRSWSVAVLLVSAVICSFFFCSTINSNTAENLLRKLRINTGREEHVPLLPQKRAVGKQSDNKPLGQVKVERGNQRSSYEEMREHQVDGEYEHALKDPSAGQVQNIKMETNSFNERSGDRQRQLTDQSLSYLEEHERQLLQDNYVVPEIEENERNKQLEQEGLGHNLDATQKEKKDDTLNKDSQNQYPVFKVRRLQSIDMVEDDPRTSMNQRLLGGENPYNTRRLLSVEEDEDEEDPTTTEVEYVDDPYWKPPIPFEGFSQEEIKYVDHLPDVECERDENGRCTSDDAEEREKLDGLRRKRYIEIASSIVQRRAKNVEYDEDLETTTESLYDYYETDTRRKGKYESL